jgi:putative transposase
MQRLACPEQARIPLHLVQRGRARAACFSCAGDRLAYLELLRECALEAECSVHAWALMGNHVHLLFTSVRARGAARLVSPLVARYAHHLTSAYGHVDAVWEEPYDATPVHTRAQLLHCMRYIEENPVRAGVAPSPGAWRWSSYRCNALGEDDALVTPHSHYCSLGRSPAERSAAYAVLFDRPAINRRARRFPSPPSPSARCRS